jgi:hypothetical protein
MMTGIGEVDDAEDAEGAAEGTTTITVGAPTVTVGVTAEDSTPDALAADETNDARTAE